MTLAHATVDVAEMRALLERASIVGPLTSYDCGEYGSDVDDAEGTAVAHTTGAAASPLAALIVAAINALPALLDRLERAEKVARAGATLRREALGRLVQEAGHCATCDAALAFDAAFAALDDEAPR